MKTLMIGILSYTFLISGLIAGNWYGQIELQRLSVWITWAFIMVCLWALVVPSEKFYKKPAPKSKIIRILFCCHLVLLVATGWFFTAAMLAVSWVAHLMKRELWNEKQKESKAEAVPQ